MNPIPRTLGILVFKDVEELDFVGPWEMLRMWGLYADGPKDCLIVAESREPVLCAKGLSVNPHVDFADCPALDVLLVPGGQGTRQEVQNRVLVDFVARQVAGCQSVLSVCTGFFVLHAAGLLKGKRATTHWRRPATPARAGRRRRAGRALRARRQALVVGRRLGRHRHDAGLHRPCGR